jgi:glycogen debranching enzyme
MTDIISDTEWLDRKTSLAELLASNQVRSGGYRYTRPAPSTYEHQWLWDSCFHAIGYRWIDPGMAREELLSVTSHPVEDGPDAGMLPHMIYWNGGGQELWQHPARSTITQPPLAGVAAWKVFALAHDRELLEILYPRLAAFHAWLDRRRDPDGDDLACLIHPWESGCDSSPRWDRAMQLSGQFDPSAGTAARKALAARLPSYGYNAELLGQAGSFLVEAIDYNAIRAADLEALAEIARELNKPDDAAHWLHRAHAVQRAVQTRLLEPAPHDLEGREETPIWADSASQFVALFGGCATGEQARKLVARLQQPDYWTTYPVPTTPTSAPEFSPEQYWRGNTWIPVNYLIYIGLRRYGYNSLASQLASRTLDLVRQSGYHEYFHPLTGRGLGAASQSWSCLLLDMMAEEKGLT